MIRLLAKATDFLMRYWWWFFALATCWTFISGFFLYIALMAFTPQDILRRLGWSRPPEVVEVWEPFIYVFSIGGIVTLLCTTVLPISYMFYLRFFGFKRNGRV